MLRTYLSALLFCAGALAQNIVVDATPSHVANTFSPIKSLGGTVDRLGNGVAEHAMTEPMLSKILDAGWQTITYRQNTELFAEAWHWNSEGTWSDPAGQQGYFTGNPNPTGELIHSYGAALPHLGTTRNSRGGGVYYSRLTDGDETSYWKSNPYLTKGFTGDDDSMHPQWVLIDLGSLQPVNAVRIAWAQPYATHYAVQFWTGGETNPRQATAGLWQSFPAGRIADGKGGTVTLTLTRFEVPTRYLRVFMTASSNTCDTHGSSDKRNCVGYAINELYIGTIRNGAFTDLLKHGKTNDQTHTLASSQDPWHRVSDINQAAGEHVGFDYFFKSGITRGLPAMMATALLYGQPEDSANQIAWLKKRGYPISYIELGEEADGQRAMPEDIATLYVQWFKAIHKVDPSAKLGGPSFEGVNQDIKVWPDVDGRVSWFGRFLDYLRDHNALSELAFMSYEHYPYTPCRSTWDDLYREPQLITHIMDVWNDDGLPATTPQFMTEGNMSSRASGTFVDVSGGLWLADYVGSFLTHGGAATYFFHTIPGRLGAGCGDNMGAAMATLNMGPNFTVRGHLSQYYGSILINKEWVQPVDKDHKVFPASSDVRDAAGRTAVTGYAVLRPDGQWAVMLVNRDHDNQELVRVSFHDAESKTDKFFTGQVKMVNWGAAQYVWHPAGADGHADPDDPPVTSKVDARPELSFTLPKASVTVLVGQIK